MKRFVHPHLTRYRGLASFTIGLALLATSAHADVTFLGVASGDSSPSTATFWTRAVDSVTPVSVTLTLQITTDPTFNTGVSQVTGTTDVARDYICKLDVINLTPNTKYYYRFIGPGNELSNVGKIKTVPDATAAVRVHFAFSGDNDGLMRPYALASVIPSYNLDFYINLGDVIYENASNVKGTIGLSYTNSPSVTLSSDSLSFNGVPRAFIPAGMPFATQAQLRSDYAKKYRENFLPVNTGGQNSLQVLYAAQGNYTTWDNHELGNRKYIDGGAPAGGSVGGAAGTDMPTGRGVDARNNGAGNVGNVNDAADLLTPADLASLGGFMNQAQGFLALEDVFLSYQPIANRGTINAPTDPRTHGTRQLYSAQQWGKNAILINADTRSYRDIRLKTPTANADDTGSRADNASRTYLGVTQLAWLKQTLLDAQNKGVPWKFVVLSDPIDQIGPVAGALSTVTAAAMQSYSGNASYGPVNADGGKAYLGGYRTERNALLKFIADNQIVNVVFFSTDDHQNRINELYYSPSGRTGPGNSGFTQADYVKVPYCFSIVCGPLGATGPDLFVNHGYASLQGAANLIASAQSAAGIDPIGLAANYPGLHDVMRDKGSGLVAETTIEPATFYSPDTFNFTLLDVSTDGKTLTVSSVGMNSTAQNTATEYSAGPQARTIFSFQVDGATKPEFTSVPSDVTVGNDKGDCSALLNFNAVASGFPVPVVSYTLNGVSISSPYNFPKGVSAVTCIASNSQGTASSTFKVTVNDTEVPAIQSVTPSKTVLFPPNHKMIPVSLTVVATDNCGIATTKIVSVTSNEPARIDDDDRAPDWRITGDLSLQLRAERSGKGRGRVYTITVEVTDRAGNKSQKATFVTVPHDKKDDEKDGRDRDYRKDRHDRGEQD